MPTHKVTYNASIILVAILVITGCTPTSQQPCTLSTNMPVVAYRLPDSASNVFGTMSTGDTFDILARTADGWLGFDPGVAQAGNIGFAHHRWVLMNVTTAPSCLNSVDLVTLTDVEADMAASNP